MIAGDEDTYINVSDMEELFRRQGIEKERVLEIL